jgi:lipopolysaccharide exporter
VDDDKFRLSNMKCIEDDSAASRTITAPPSAETEFSPYALVIRGSVWTIALRWAVRLLGLASTVFLVRFLTPRDFGIVAIAMLVVGMIEIFSETGQRLALIRHPAPTREHYDSAWTISILIGLALGTLIFAVAPVTMHYFHEAESVTVMHFLALRAVLGGFENIGVVMLRRNLNFSRLFKYSIWVKLTSFVVTIPLAFVLRNYWALVFGIIMSQLASVVLSYVMHPYRPRICFAKVRELWSFSTWALFKHVGNYASARLDEFLVGGLFGAASMGRYNVSADIATAATNEINAPMIATLFPVMSTIQSQPDKLRALYLRSLYLSGLLCVSTSVGVAVSAREIVDVVLGYQWHSTEHLIIYLALAGGLLGLSQSVYTFLDVIGQPRLGARLMWTRALALAAVLVPTGYLLHSMEAIAAARLAVMAAVLPGMFIPLRQSLGLTLHDVAATLWRPLAAGAVMAAIVPMMGIIPAGYLELRLAAKVVLGIASYTAALYGLWYLTGRPVGPERDVLDRLCRRSARVSAQGSALIELEEASRPSGR